MELGEKCDPDDLRCGEGLICLDGICKYDGECTIPNILRNIPGKRCHCSNDYQLEYCDDKCGPDVRCKYTDGGKKCEYYRKDRDYPPEYADYQYGIYLRPPRPVNYTNLPEEHVEDYMNLDINDFKIDLRCKNGFVKPNAEELLFFNDYKNPTAKVCDSPNKPFKIEGECWTRNEKNWAFFWRFILLPLLIFYIIHIISHIISPYFLKFVQIFEPRARYYDDSG